MSKGNKAQTPDGGVFRTMYEAKLQLKNLLKISVSGYIFFDLGPKVAVKICSLSGAVTTLTERILGFVWKLSDFNPWEKLQLSTQSVSKISRINLIKLIVNIWIVKNLYLQIKIFCKTLLLYFIRCYLTLSHYNLLQ